MPAPTITALPPAPSRGDAPAEFNAKADDLVAAWPGFVTETNAAAAYVETAAAASATSATEAEAAAGAAAASAATSAATASTALAGIEAALAAGNVYTTKAALTTALSGLAANAYAYVIADETQGNRHTLYQKQSGVAVLQWRDGTAVQWYVDPRTGSNSNAGTAAAPFLTQTKAKTMVAEGDTIWLETGVYSLDDFQADAQAGSYLTKGVNVRVRGGGRAILNGFDKVASAGWTSNSGAWASPTVSSTIGLNGTKISGPLTHPGLAYKLPGIAEWRGLALKTRSDFASDAAGIAYIQANAGYAYIQDTGGHGCSYSAGWEWTTLVYHVHLPDDVDPTTCEWMVRQRSACIPFSTRHLIEGLTDLGNCHRNGFAPRNSTVKKTEVVYPGCHGSEITGNEFDDFAMIGGVPGTEGHGYAVHSFGMESNWNEQFRAHWGKLSVLDWQGAVFGCHGTGTTTPAPGPASTVTSEIVIDDLYVQNVNTLFDAYAMNGGSIVINNAVIDGFTALGSASIDIVMNSPRVRHRAPVFAGVVTPSGTAALLEIKYGGSWIVNGGEIFQQNGSRMWQCSSGALPNAKIIFNHTRMLTTVSGTLCTSAFGGLELNQSAIQYVGPSRGSARADPINLIDNAIPVKLTESVLGGFTTSSLTALTTDIHTIVGGDAGMRPGTSMGHLIEIDQHSPFRARGERFIAGVAINQGFAMLTSRRLYSFNSGFMDETGLDSAALYTLLPSAFTPRGMFNRHSYASNTVGVYGNGGKVYTAPVNAGGAPTMTAKTSGVTTNFIAHVALSSSVILLLGDAGEIVKWDMATDTFTAQTSGVAYPLRGGIALDASNALVFGCNDAESTGGVRKTTDGGTTWAAADASVATRTNILCATVVNGFMLLGSGTGGLYTCPTASGVGAAFTQRTLNGSPAWLALYPDAGGSKKVAFIGGSSYGSAPKPRLGRISRFGWLDAADASPANWTVRFDTKPLPHVTTVLSGSVYDGSDLTPTPTIVFGQSRFAAQTENPYSADWTYFGEGSVAALPHAPPNWQPRGMDVAYLYA